ncbi:hypothetical protein GN244_ATG09141 [Phytophthora infestans]|uniref:Uncharacterized protein n=1 Tax=Phytophthora infestans TaxID=4787 RepID=A0A833WV32_PHYIN|nr:hypothetical protein GN244_ATG09141 [Phytophthora infestans]
MSIYLWRKQNDKLLQLCKTSSSAELRKIRAVGTDSAPPADAEVHTVKWINAYRTQDLPVSTLMLHRKLCLQCQDEANEGGGVEVVHNADQTPDLFECLPKSTITAKGFHTVWVRSTCKDKEKLTQMLLGDSLGRKYSYYIIVRAKPSKVPATRSGNNKKAWVSQAAIGNSGATSSTAQRRHLQEL